MRNSFHNFFNAKRRGGSRPVRLRISARRGVSLVELLIAMLILTIVCIAWLEIIGIQSARREARRREAVERLAGMMDAFMYVNKNTATGTGLFHMDEKSTQISFVKERTSTTVYPVFNTGLSPIGYQLRVVSAADLPNSDSFSGWTSDRYWLVGCLYDHHGSLAEAGKPFFTLPVYRGRR